MNDWIPANPDAAAPPGPQLPPDTGPGVTPALPPDAAPRLLPAASAVGRTVWQPPDIPFDLSRQGLHVGTGGYHFADWPGRFYPPGSPARDWYPFYQLYFSFLELNHTFYREPLVRDFVQLERRSKPGMLFSVKVHKDITHKGIWDAREGRSLMRRHAAAVGPLAEAGRFYSFLIQLDESVERGRKVLDYLLETASAAVSEGLDAHVEFRNRTWHQEPVLQSLKDAGVGICNTEIPGLPHAFPLKAYATTGKAYVRYCGLNLAGWAAEGAGSLERGGGSSRDASSRDAKSPTERLRARNARYDYRYSQAELEARVRGQLRMLEKAGQAAVVFKNHVGGHAALNALQNVRLLSQRRP